MTPEELRVARIAEAWRRSDRPSADPLEHLADLYETNWTPPAEDPDVMAAISYAKIAIDDDGGFINTIVKNAYLAGCTRGREGAKGLVEALEEARELVESWGAYASQYFQEKHDLAGDLIRLDAALASAKRGG